MSFFSRLENRILEVDSLLCIGLDPHPDDLTPFSADSAKEFCLRLIEATADLAAAYKPNAAFFEVHGPEGIAALKDVIAAVPEDIPVILDAKRGDIASTAQAYAQAVFDTLGADAVTINPYLGKDAVDPFLADPDKGVFMLCKTTNPGAADLQDLPVGGIHGLPLHVHVAKLGQKWIANNNLGLVVGATQPESLALVRAAAPDLWILSPGIGAQGGDLKAALQAGLRADGFGMLISVSRGISRAVDPRQAAVELRDGINRERETVRMQNIKVGMQNSPFHIPHSALADALLEAGCIQFGAFTLKSGIESPIYIDLRRLVAYPQLLSRVAEAYILILQNLKFDHLAALPYAAMPITSTISLQSGWPMIYPRKEVKTYGTKAQIEGVYQSGDKAVVIDDLISTGGSKFEGIEKLESAGLEVEDVVVLINRSPDHGADLAESGYKLYAVLTISDLLDYFELSEKIDKTKISEVREFLAK
jgi:uridine monophosphate synthetase